MFYMKMGVIANAMVRAYLNVHGTKETRIHARQKENGRLYRAGSGELFGYGLLRLGVDMLIWFVCSYF